MQLAGRGKKKPKIGDLLNPNYEVILAAKPDLVIASTAGNDRGAVMKLAGLGFRCMSRPRATSKESFNPSKRSGGSPTVPSGDSTRGADEGAPGQRQAAYRRDFLPCAHFLSHGSIRCWRPGKTLSKMMSLRLAGVVSITADIRSILSAIQSRTDAGQGSRRHSDRRAGRRSHSRFQKNRRVARSAGGAGRARFIS